MAIHSDEKAAVREVLAGGGEMGRLMHEMDWSRTPLGPVAGWPQSLRTAVSICLNSRYPILIWWGPEYVKLYNDAYRPILGESKHPAALGAPGREIWPEIWPIIGPMLDGVYHAGRATWSDDQLLLMNRNGYLEETYFTFSYSPIRDESGGVGGIFTAVTETTERVLSERRLRTLQELSIGAKTVDAAAAHALEILQQNRRDIPFALVYLLESDNPTVGGPTIGGPTIAGWIARLAGATGLARGSRACPAHVLISEDALLQEAVPQADTVPQETVSGEAVPEGALREGALAQGALSSGGEPGWPLAQVVASGQAALVDNLAARFGRLPGGGAWPDPPTTAIVLPIPQPGQDAPAALLVLGISPRRAFDAAYRSFFQSLAGHFATVLTTARAYEEERRRAEALAELDRAKTQFFSNISHEFRTPLTLQLGPLQDLLDGRLGTLAPDQREATEMVYRNSLRSLKLVNTLLDFTRVEAGRLQATFEPVDLATYTTDLASTFRSTIERAGLVFGVDCPPLAEPVYIDRNLWEQIVLNLLSNAFKFTLQGEICVTLREDGRRAVLTVSDTGAGIATEDVPHVFERFYRARESQARTHEGAGIGLALVQELVKLHGGAITVQSGPGEGAVFTVTLPFGRSHLPAERIITSRPAIPGSLTAQSYLEEVRHWLRSAAPAPAQAALSADLEGPRVLVADDNADMRAYIQRILGQRYRVETVADGEKALEAAHARRPDLVLADVMMPCLDGFGLLAAMRADPELARVPMILLSARAGEEARAEGLEAGANDYLVKPFSARELLARVAKRLEVAAAAAAREREALQVGNERLEILHAMDQGILAAKSLSEIAEIAARYLRRAMAAYRVSVALFDFGADIAHVLAADADPSFAPGPVDIPALSHFAPLEANLRGDVGYVEELAEMPGQHPLQDALLAAGVHSLTSVPLQIVPADGASERGVLDAGVKDAEAMDAEVVDAEVYDAGVTDAGVERGGPRTIGSLLIACAPPGRPDPALVNFAAQVAVSLSLAIQSATYVQSLAEREATLAETAAMLQSSRQEFQALSRRLVEALENERETLARNLHDEAGQALTVLGLGLARLTRRGGLDPETTARLEELKQLTSNIAIDLRRIATDLRPISLDRLGLVAALQQYVDAYTQQTGVQVSLSAAGLREEHHDPEVETVLYRIVQESLSNVAHHAAARHAAIEVTGTAGEVRLTVRDDGQGFDMDEALRRGRLGLLGMRERAEMLGGALSVESAPGAGATVTVVMPLPERSVQQ